MYTAEDVSPDDCKINNTNTNNNNKLQLVYNNCVAIQRAQQLRDMQININNNQQ